MFIDPFLNAIIIGHLVACTIQN